MSSFCWLVNTLMVSSVVLAAGVGGVTSKEEEPIQCLCGQYRWALSNPRRAKLTTYHCDDPTEELKAKV